MFPHGDAHVVSSAQGMRGDPPNLRWFGESAGERLRSASRTRSRRRHPAHRRERPDRPPHARAAGDGARARRPKVGRQYLLPTFNPLDDGVGNRGGCEFAPSPCSRGRLRAFDAPSGVWVSALTDTVRAWHVERGTAGGGFTGWVDAQGRVVLATSRLASRSAAWRTRSRSRTGGSPATRPRRRVRAAGRATSWSARRSRRE